MADSFTSGRNRASRERALASTASTPASSARALASAASKGAASSVNNRSPGLTLLPSVKCRAAITPSTRERISSER